MGQVEKRISETKGVLVFYAGWCGYCRKAMAELEKAGIEFEGVDVEVKFKNTVIPNLQCWTPPLPTR